ncbi:hypothetical protein B0T18DRAFT_410550 [Schizothecium vesticola]|uniref:Uncharacterized protein n=1 Tax=Schizothecium vesticola TaxID=314040 RepID=A0AA40EUZ2_9PEZI|nr:hypothetical protein B0T18DRAFT_410550 [Schizothecium vesticola]
MLRRLPRSDQVAGQDLSYGKHSRDGGFRDPRAGQGLRHLRLSHFLCRHRWT